MFALNVSKRFDDLSKEDVQNKKNKNFEKKFPK